MAEGDCNCGKPTLAIEAAIAAAEKPSRKIMRNISFAITKTQVVTKQKTVTRRLGWHDLAAGTLLQGVEKAQGLKKGEKVKPLCKVRVLSVTHQVLHQITAEDVEREGFPGMTPDEFIAMFCKANKGCTSTTEVTRIEFEYVD